MEGLEKRRKWVKDRMYTRVSSEGAGEGGKVDAIEINPFW